MPHPRGALNAAVACCCCCCCCACKRRVHASMRVCVCARACMRMCLWCNSFLMKPLLLCQLVCHYSTSGLLRTSSAAPVTCPAVIWFVADVATRHTTESKVLMQVRASFCQLENNPTKKSRCGPALRVEYTRHERRRGPARAFVVPQTSCVPRRKACECTNKNPSLTYPWYASASALLLLPSGNMKICVCSPHCRYPPATKPAHLSPSVCIPWLTQRAI